MKSEPIFIVGAPRSGTTLLAAMMGAHSRMSCGPETHFFRYLSKADEEQLCNKETWPRLAAEFLSTITYNTFSGNRREHLIEKYQLEEKDIVLFLEKREATTAQLLAALTETFMKRTGKSRWIEKTPDHLAHVATIRRIFPESPIIRIVRDPRDIAVSITKVPWGTTNLVDALLYWRYLDETSENFFKRDKLAYTIRFEDLIMSPKLELTRICKYVGEAFEEAMLDTSSTGKQINTSGVPWKEKASKPVDSSRIYAWRNVLTPKENRAAEALVGDRLKTYEYPREESFIRLGEILPRPKMAAKYPDAFQSLLPKGVRFWKIESGETPTVKLYIGDPDMDNWLGEKRFERLVNMLSISTGIIKSYTTRNSVYWIRGQSELQSSQQGSLLKSFLQNIMPSPAV